MLPSYRASVTPVRAGTRRPATSSPPSRSPAPARDTSDRLSLLDPTLRERICAALDAERHDEGDIVPTLTTTPTTSTGSARGDDLGDDHERDRLTLPTLGDIDRGGLVMMTRATTATADCGVSAGRRRASKIEVTLSLLRVMARPTWPLACSPPSS